MAGNNYLFEKDGDNQGNLTANTSGFITTFFSNFSSEVNLSFVTELVPSVNETIAIPETTLLLFGLCGTDFENSSAYPENQTSTQAIINITNNGTADVNAIQGMLIGNLANNWTIYAGNSSNSSLSIAMVNTTYTNVSVSTLTAGSIKHLWLFANCSFVDTNPNVDITFRAYS